MSNMLLGPVLSVRSPKCSFGIKDIKMEDTSVARLKQNYTKEGMRKCVEGILLMGRVKRPEWQYVDQVKACKKGQWTCKCKFCGHTWDGGPARIRYHLLKIDGHGVGPCDQLPDAVKEVVTRLHADARGDGTDRNDYVNELVNAMGEEASQSVNDATASTHASNSSKSKKRKGYEANLGSAFYLQARKHADQALRRFFYAEDISEWKQLQQAARDSLVKGLPTVRSPTGVCEPCQLGKQHRVAFPKQASTRASAPLALVHTDLCGPLSTSSLSGLCYMLVLVDDFSRYTWVSFLKLKSEAFGSIRDWKAIVEKEKDPKVKSIRSDRGGEFLSENFARWCKSEGIRRQLTTPYTPSQNGVVERKNSTIMEMARAMLAHASLPRSYWAKACNTAEKRQKLDFKSRKLLFLGYSAESDAYRLYDPDTRTTTVSRDVVFDESFITSAEGASAQPIPILPPPSLPDPPASPVITPSTSHPVPPIQPPDVSPDHALSDSDSDLDVADATHEVDLAPPRLEKRIPGWLYSTVASSGVTELPVPPPAGLPRRSARLQKRGQVYESNEFVNFALMSQI
ncbi:hypothetical protein L7F22_058449 [Adiantum nelumboides]|nr:hypothetical protein [Adiantum nelumboides]